MPLDVTKNTLGDRKKMGSATKEALETNGENNDGKGLQKSGKIKQGIPTASRLNQTEIIYLFNETAMPEEHNADSPPTESSEQQRRCLEAIVKTNPQLFLEFAKPIAAEARLEELATSDRENFVSFVSKWAKESANPDEARELEVSGKFRREASKLNNTTKQAESEPSKSIRITKGKYIEERWWEDGTSKIRPLGKIISKENKIVLKENVDFNKYYISPAFSSLLALEERAIEISPE